MIVFFRTRSIDVIFLNIKLLTLILFRLAPNFIRIRKKQGIFYVRINGEMLS